MKHKKLIITYYSILILTFLIGCEKSEIENSPIITLEINNITPYSAISGGEISSAESLQINARGVCWGLTTNPKYSDNHSSDSLGFGRYSSKVENLAAGCTYYLRAYYINESDTVYGNQLEFTTPNHIIFNPNVIYDSISDIDGNVYKTVRIGDQTWMAENLKVTHYRNSDVIDNVTDLSKWGFFNITTAAYCWYNNDISNKNVYGAMYNWYAATDNRGIAPLGWHVASVEDWQKLNNFINTFNDLQQNMGYKLRETTSAHWSINNYFSSLGLPTTNETGFTALPGGKVVPGEFSGIGGDYAYFWTNNGTLDGSSCVYVGIDITIDNLQPNCRGFNIRCVKD